MPKIPPNSLNGAPQKSFSPPSSSQNSSQKSFTSPHTLSQSPPFQKEIGFSSPTDEIPESKHASPYNTVEGTEELPPALPLVNTFLGLKLPKEDQGNVIHLPKEEGKFATLLKGWEKSANHYADHMFADADIELKEEITRLERLIPGTDQESLPPPSRIKKEKKQRALPPEESPYRLQQVYQAQITSLFYRRYVLFLLVVLSLILTLNSHWITPYLPWLAHYPNQVLTLAILLSLGLLCSLDVVGTGLKRGFLGSIGMNTLLAFSALISLTDCYFLITTLENERTSLPYCSILILTLFLSLEGLYNKKRSLKLACTVVTKTKTPFLLTLSPNKWDGRSAYTKCTDVPAGFTSQLQMEDGSEKFWHFFAPILLLLSLGCSLLLAPNLPHFFWMLSVLLTVSVPCGFGLIYSRGAYKIAKKLSKFRAALAGWYGIEKAGRQCVICDTDLFPAASVSLSGIRVFEGFSEKKVVAYTTALIQQGELGIARIFQALLGKMGLTAPQGRELAYYEGGGIGGKIGKDEVLVGGASFMELLEIPVPEGLFLPHAIFCAINGELAGIFALDYQLPDSVPICLEGLSRERIQLVLGTRDFAVTPEILKDKFKLKSIPLLFPSILRRRELSQDSRPEDGRLIGLFSRSGLEALSDTIIAAKKLRKFTYFALFVAVISTLLAFTLSAYLVSQFAYTSLSPRNLLVYMSLWLAPIWVITDLPHRF